MFESLEPRSLLAVTTSFASGVLTVTGDDHANAVLISTNSHGEIFVHVDHHVITAVPAHGVTAIHVNLGGGNDSLETAYTVVAPMTIRGGAGNDTLLGGSGHDAIFGDDGNDLINAQDGHIDSIDGGAGDDTAKVDHVDSVVNVEHITRTPHHHGGGHNGHRAALAIRSGEDLQLDRLRFI